MFISVLYVNVPFKGNSFWLCLFAYSRQMNMTAKPEKLNYTFKTIGLVLSVPKSSLHPSLSFIPLSAQHTVQRWQEVFFVNPLSIIRPYEICMQERLTSWNNISCDRDPCSSYSLVFSGTHYRVSFFIKACSVHLLIIRFIHYSVLGVHSLSFSLYNTWLRHIVASCGIR